MYVNRIGCRLLCLKKTTNLIVRKSFFHLHFVFSSFSFTLHWNCFFFFFHFLVFSRPSLFKSLCVFCSRFTVCCDQSASTVKSVKLWRACKQRRLSGHLNNFPLLANCFRTQPVFLSLLLRFYSFYEKRTHAGSCISAHIMKIHLSQQGRILKSAVNKGEAVVSLTGNLSVAHWLSCTG